MNGLPNPRIGPTAAKIGNLAIDVGVTGFAVLSQQRRSRHDLSRLAISALRHVTFPPRDLERMLRVGRESLYRRHIFPRSLAYRLGARAHRLAIHMHRARAAQPHPTSVL